MTSAIMFSCYQLLNILCVTIYRKVINKIDHNDAELFATVGQLHRLWSNVKPRIITSVHCNQNIVTVSIDHVIIITKCHRFQGDSALVTNVMSSAHVQCAGESETKYEDKEEEERPGK